MPNASASVRRGAQAFSLDTLATYGPRVFTRTGDTVSAYMDDFTAAVDTSRRYVLVVANGAPDGTKRVTQCIVSLNAATVVDEQQLTSATPAFSTTVDLVTNNHLDLVLQGPLGSFVTVGVVAVPSGEFRVFGPETFPRASTAPQTVTRSFDAPADGCAPFTLRLVNGDGLGGARVTSAKVWLNGTQVLKPTDFGSEVATLRRQVSLLAHNTLEVRVAGGPETHFDLSITATDCTPPSLTIESPAESLLTNADSVTVTGTVVDRSPTDVRVNGVLATSVTPTGYTARVPLLAEGIDTLTVVATDAAGNHTTLTRTVFRDSQPPALAVNTPPDSLVTTASSIGVSGTVTDAHTVLLTVNGDTVTTSGGSFSTSVALALGDNTITVRAQDSAGNASVVSRAVRRNPTGGGNLPPDPSLVATPLDPTSITPFLDGTRFLYTGTNPIQSGVAQGTIEVNRVAVVRGRTLMRDGSVLTGVRVEILDHPEFGFTVSRADGGYDLAVNGGGPLTLRFSKNGFISAQRRVDTPWRDFASVPDVALIGYDPEVTAVDFSAPIEVARGSSVSDTDGTRRATLLFEQGTTAQMVMPDGSRTNLPSLHVRATEYTVGPNGKLAMPAALPPASAYTYCVELSADEAVTAGADRVEFSKPVPFYVENFLEAPVGAGVPVGTYNRHTGMWEPLRNGHVLRVLDTAGGVASIDVNGDSVADVGAALDTIGIDLAERQQLAALYSPGQSLWRVEFPHFSPGDLNWPFSFPFDAKRPNGGHATQLEPGENDCTTCPGSSIQAENSVLGEEVPVAGTGEALHYSSERVPGRRIAYTIRIPLTKSVVPASVRRIEVHIDVAGRHVEQNYSVSPNQTIEFEWDGRDAYGRSVTGAVMAHVKAGWVYPNVYVASPSGGRGYEFGGPGLLNSFSFAKRPLEGVIFLDTDVPIGTVQNTYASLGGWSLTDHHAYDMNGEGTLHMGDGTRVNGERLTAVFRQTRTYNGVFGRDMLLAPDGSVYSCGGFPPFEKIFKYPPTGGEINIAGSPGDGHIAVDGELATQADIVGPGGIALGADGTLYFTDTGQFRVFRITPDDRIYRFAGAGGSDSTGNDGPALQAKFGDMGHIAVGPDGSVYVVDTRYGQIRRIAPDGTITKFAGNTPGFSGDGGPARAARLNIGSGEIAFDRDGNLIVVDAGNSRVRMISTDGTIRTIAVIPGVNALATATDGSVYAADGTIIYHILPDGEVVPVAGGGNQGPVNGGPGLQVTFGAIVGLDVAPDQRVYLLDSRSTAQFVTGFIEPAMPGFTTSESLVADQNKGELYVFNTAGKHLRTLDAMTGGVLRRFEYDAAGRLLRVVDADNQTTTIERDAGGTPTAIVGHFGHRTTIGVAPNGYLSSISDPLSHTVTLVHDGGGLLTQMRDPRGNLHTFQYDGRGRLSLDSDPAGGHTSLNATGTDSSRTVSIATAEGVNASYGTTLLPDGSHRRTMFGSDGLRTVVTDSSNAMLSVAAPDGSRLTTARVSDGRFGLMMPVPQSVVARMPSGLTATVNTNRAVSVLSGDLKRIDNWIEDTSVNGRPAFRTTFSGPSRRFVFTTPLGRTTTTDVDTAGRPFSVTVPGINVVTSTYDALGRLSQTHHGARLWQYAYDANGRLSSVTDPLLRQITYEYDAADRLTRQSLPGGREILYGYDANGNITTVTPPGRPVHGIEHTVVDLDSLYAPPTLPDVADVATHYTYDRDRRLTSVLRPDGVAVSLSYDGAGRLSSLLQPRGVNQFTYTPTGGQLATVTSPDGVTCSYTYDGGLTLQEQWSGAVTGSVTRGFDTDLRIASQSVNSGPPVTFAYDTDGLLSRAGTLTITRSAANGLVTGTAMAGVTTSQTFSPFGELATFSATGPFGLLHSSSYDRDPGGRVTRWTLTVAGATHVRDFGYDTAGRLQTVRDGGVLMEQYAYDVNGNRTTFTGTTPADSASGTYDAQDRLQRYGNTIFRYTANGDLALRATGADTTRYTYDALGNLITVLLPTGDKIEYVIDGENRRVGRKLNGVMTNGWLYQSGLNPVAELDGVGTIVARYVYATRGHVPAYVVKGDSTYRLLTDHLGSIRQVVNVASGLVAQECDYDAWGRTTLNTAPGFITLGFAGGIEDSGTGLVRFGARDYDAVVGRWTAKDPIGFMGRDANLTAYCFEDPVNNFDSDGASATVAQQILGPAVLGGGGASAVGQTIIKNLPNIPPPAQVIVGGFIIGFSIGTIVNVYYGPDIQDAMGRVFYPGNCLFFAKRTPAKGPPGKSVVIEDYPDGGRIRTYGPDGRAVRDVDYGHDHGGGDPHVHDWDWGKPRGDERGEGRPPEPGDLK